MSITVSAVKARQNLGELLNLVSIKHEDVIIERAGKKIARLTPIDEGVVCEKPNIMDLYGTGKEMWERTGLTPNEYVRKEREEWD